MDPPVLLSTLMSSPGALGCTFQSLFSYRRFSRASDMILKTQDILKDAPNGKKNSQWYVITMFPKYSLIEFPLDFSVEYI